MPVEFIIQFMVVVERLIRSKDFCRSRPHILNRHIGGEDIVQFLDDQLLSERKGGSLTDVLRRSADLHLIASGLGHPAADAAAEGAKRTGIERKGKHLTLTGRKKPGFGKTFQFPLRLVLQDGRRRQIKLNDLFSGDFARVGDLTETSIRPGNESLLSVRSEYSNRVQESP